MISEPGERVWIACGEANMRMAKYMADDREATIKLLTGFDSCLLGVVPYHGHLKAAYSVSQIINVLAEEMDRDEAYEYFSFNVVRSVEYDDSEDAPLLVFDVTEEIEDDRHQETTTFQPVPPASTN